MAYLLTRCNITKQSWLVLFNVGSGVHLQLAGQQWTGADIEWNSVIMTVCGDFEYIYLPMWCFVKNFVVYLTKIIYVCAYFYWTIVLWQFEFSCLVNTCLLTFFDKKALPLETLDSSQFTISISCHFEILDLYILAVFGSG